MKSREYWDSNFEDRYKSRKSEWAKLPLKVIYCFVIKRVIIVSSKWNLPFAFSYFLFESHLFQCLPFNIIPVVSEFSHTQFSQSFRLHELDYKITNSIRFFIIIIRSVNAKTLKSAFKNSDGCLTQVA